MFEPWGGRPPRLACGKDHRAAPDHAIITTVTLGSSSNRHGHWFVNLFPAAGAKGRGLQAAGVGAARHGGGRSVNPKITSTTADNLSQVWVSRYPSPGPQNSVDDNLGIDYLSVRARAGTIGTFCRSSLITRAKESMDQSGHLCCDMLCMTTPGIC